MFLHPANILSVSLTDTDTTVAPTQAARAQRPIDPNNPRVIAAAPGPRDPSLPRMLSTSQVVIDPNNPRMTFLLFFVVTTVQLI